MKDDGDNEEEDDNDKYEDGWANGFNLHDWCLVTSFSWQKRIQNCTERTVGYPDNYNGKTMQ